MDSLRDELNFNSYTIDSLLPKVREKALNDKAIEQQLEIALQGEYVNQDELVAKLGTLKSELDSNATILEDFLKNSLTDVEQASLDEYEQVIIQKSRELVVDTFLKTITGETILATALSLEQESLRRQISSNVSMRDDLGKRYLGTTLQRHPPSSSSFVFDVSAHLIESTAQLKKVLTPEQREHIDFDRIAAISL